MNKNNFTVLLFLFFFVICGLLLLGHVREYLFAVISDKILHRSFRTDFWNKEILGFGITGILISTVGLCVFCPSRPIIVMPESHRSTIKIEIIIISIFAIFACFLSCINSSIWYDEAFSICSAKKPFDELIKAMASDNHPPFYYIVLHLAYLIGGHNLFILKLVSIVPAVLTMVVITVFFNRNYSHRSALFFLAAYMALEIYIHNAIEIRMYSWAFFFIAIVAVSSRNIVKNKQKKWRLFYILGVVGAAYTNHYAAFTAGIAWLLLFIHVWSMQKHLVKQVLILAAVSFFLYLPQLPTTLNQVFFFSSGTNFWLTSSTNLRSLLDYINTIFSNGSLFVAFLFLIAFVFLIFKSIKTKTDTGRDVYAYNCLACFLLLLFTNILIAMTVRPLLIGRYLVPASVLVWIFFAIEADRLLSKKMSVFVFYSLLVMSGYLFVNTSLTETAENKNFEEFKHSAIFSCNEDAIFLYSNKSIIPPGANFNLQISGIISCFLPDHTHVCYELEQKSDYYDSLFLKNTVDFNIFSQSKALQDRQMFIIVSKWESDDELKKMPVDWSKAVYCGTYEWNISKFKVYCINNL